MYGSVCDLSDISENNETSSLLKNKKSKNYQSQLFDTLFFIIANVSGIILVFHICARAGIYMPGFDWFQHVKYELLFMTISDTVTHLSYTIPYTIVFPELSNHIYMLPFVLTLFSRLNAFFTSYTMGDNIEYQIPMVYPPIYKIINMLLFHGGIILVIPFYVYHNIHHNQKFSINKRTLVCITIIITHFISATLVFMTKDYNALIKEHSGRLLIIVSLTQIFKHMSLHDQCNNLIDKLATVIVFNIYQLNLQNISVIVYDYFKLNETVKSDQYKYIKVLLIYHTIYYLVKNNCSFIKDRIEKWIR